MDPVLSMIKGYFLFMLILLVISYLTPKDRYRKYIQFVAGALVGVLLLRSAFSFSADLRIREKDLIEQLKNTPKWQAKGENLYGYSQMETQREE